MVERESMIKDIVHRLNNHVDDCRVLASSNFLDECVFSEMAFCELLNILFDWHLESANRERNAEGVDLVDRTGKVSVQVSVTDTKDKVQKSLDKTHAAGYQGYKFFFLCLKQKADKIRKEKYRIPEGLTFSPAENIFDTTSLVKVLSTANRDKLEKAFDYIRKEFKSESVEALESDLAVVVVSLSKILSEEEPVDTMSTGAFEIQDKIDENDLKAFQELFEEYIPMCNSVERQIESCSTDHPGLGGDVTRHIVFLYCKYKDKDRKATDIFTHIVKACVSEVGLTPGCKSKGISFERLESCVNAIVVDVFVKCKIFKRPRGKQHVAT